MRKLRDWYYRRFGRVGELHSPYYARKFVFGKIHNEILKEKGL